MFLFKSADELTHYDKSLVCAETFVITGAGGKGYDFVAVAYAYAEVEKAHAFCGGSNGGNAYSVAVDIEAEVLGEADRKHLEGMDDSKD